MFIACVVVTVLLSLAGLKFAGLGVLAGICVILYFAGAVIVHLRA